MKKTLNITLNVTIDVHKAADGKRIPWISFQGWKHGVVNEENQFIDTDAIVQKTNDNMLYIGTEIFDAAKEMFYEDTEFTEK